MLFPGPGGGESVFDRAIGLPAEFFVGEGGVGPDGDHISRTARCELVVELDSSERKEIPPFGNVVDYLVYGGIYREVWLEEVSDIYIDNAFIRTLNVLHQKKVLDITLKTGESLSVPVVDTFYLKVDGFNQNDIIYR